MKVFQQLIAENASIQDFENYLANVKEPQSSYALLQAGIRHKIPEVRSFLVKQAKLNKTYFKRMKLTKFHIAAILGDIKTLEKATDEKLIEYNETFRWRPLRFATAANNIEAVKYIYGRVDAPEQSYLSNSLSTAIKYNLPEMVELFLDLGADYNFYRVISKLDPSTSNSILTKLVDAGLDLKNESITERLHKFDTTTFSLEDHKAFLDRLFDAGMTVTSKILAQLITPSAFHPTDQSLPLLKEILKRCDKDIIDQSIEFGEGSISLFEYAIRYLPLEVAKHLHTIGKSGKNIRVASYWIPDVPAKRKWLNSTFEKLEKLTFKEFSEMNGDWLTPDLIMEHLTFSDDGGFCGFNFPLTMEMVIDNGFKASYFNSYIFETESEAGHSWGGAMHILTIEENRMVYHLNHSKEEEVMEIYMKMQERLEAIAGKPKIKSSSYSESANWIYAGRKIRIIKGPSTGSGYEHSVSLRIEVKPVRKKDSGRLIDTTLLSKKIEVHLEGILVDVFNEGETYIEEFKVNSNQESANDPVEIIVHFTGKDDQKQDQSDSITIEVDALESANPTSQLLGDIVQKIAEAQCDWLEY